MLKRKKILTNLLLVANVPLVAASFIACKTNNDVDKNKDGKKEEEKNNVIDLNKIEVSIKYKGAEPLAMKFANETLSTDYEAVIPAEYIDKLEVKIIGMQNPSAKNGTLDVNYEVIEKGNEKNKLEKTQVFSGFQTNPFDVFRNGDISGNKRLDVGDKTSYIKKTTLERFDFDNTNYLPFITPREDRVSSAVYPTNNFDNKYLAELNNKARSKMQENYEYAKYKGFSVPFLDENGKATALNVNEGTEVGKGPSKVDAYSDEQYSLGLARTLPNETYKKIGLQTYSLFINSPGIGGNYGTTWILDYKIPENGKYPTKWYFGTNVHVAMYMNLDKETTYNTRNTTNLSNTIQFNRLTKDAGIRTTLRTTAFGSTFENWSFDTRNNKGESAFKTVYMGLNFLNSSPKDYLPTDSKLKDTEEMIDFAVFEVDFTKFDLSTVNVRTADVDTGRKYTSAEELARDMTNGYADNKDAQISFLKNSYLKDYSKIGIPLINNEIDPVYKANPNATYDSLFALGYPVTNSAAFLDHFLDEYKDTADLQAAKRSVSLWVNGRRKWYGNLTESETSDKKIDEKVLNAGNYLSYEIGYRTFIDKPGIQDSMIGNPLSGLKPFEYLVANGKESELPETINSPKKPDGFKNRYLGYGINYLLRHFSPGGGASGTSVRNQKNEMVGIVHVSNWSALTALVAAFRSEGVDYGGYYGPYKMEQYDLIYGGGKNQRLSYREALKHMYSSETGFKTNLFKERAW
ncbi:Ig-specific serine endopeptidase MIP [Mycoplasma crocodyli]|uniref:Ig-specific serine endopeptidase MIP n=1 Tax=Mycoplasma crocodyli TaxID=50052 RepID=UPI0003025821|nr:DUF31 family protein [Mycoplasma crocodyli]